ncbi:XRE family transcriptional regulator [Streptococcus pasteurianus]|uniref:XRE family transcriptional regulator n=1 Tax=Streptococcus gallolyticus TaxID=315405 RepID=UPI0022840FF2|nr:XRE family transcriptional regulator [Streptococcus gallolyticus]MCY7156226.1 XRE family transcriptional regulator [Streptococcus gallolyticus subsp. gallolyticus]
MVNVQKLKGKIMERGTTQEALAKTLRIDRSTFYRKMRQGGNFTIKEVNLIVSALHLSKDEAMSIFFADLVA